MTPEKRNKIKALMNNSESTENEKRVCRKLLKDNPETDIQPDIKEAENHWEALNGKSYGPSLEGLLGGFRQHQSQQEVWLRQEASQQASAQWQEEMRFRAGQAQQAAAQGQWQHPLADCGFVVEEKPKEKKSIFDGLLGYLWRKK